MTMNLRPALLLGLALSANAALAADAPPPPSVAQRQAISAQGAELKVTLAVDKLKISMLQGDDMGGNSFGWFCINRQPLTVTENYIKNYGAFMGSVATQELKRLGYPLAGKGQSNAFDVDVAAAPDFRIGGILTEAKHELCWLNNSAEGWIYYKIDWALFSEKQQKVVYQASAEGLAASKDKVPDLPKRAVISSLSNFLAAPAILEALKASDTAAPAAAPASAASSAAAEAPLPAAALTLKGVPATGGGALKNQAQLRNAVVTLETASGSGSGFFIDKAGHLLTNAHVVKGSKYARIKLQNGDKAVAEVVKVNEQADVALLKTALTDGDALAIRGGTALDVGSDVYAIGSPLGVLNNSMTRGVLSADRMLQGRHVLQSDAAVTFGSSGGPLLDGDGRVIAITQGGVEAGKGFNFFIPIEEALKALQLAVTP
ncbi:S1C family serine protease [Roseateles saccharophilus]|uniref:Trypsin-like peptidase n=1 Tax=Roseateles saccharophilus TaxID=304 RepID=A0A4R3UCN8_ROSSA|nr:serine protease [Roseateles saccharophilus]MDG0835576.1 serine protease [Roseateles saccharophilus]TCU85490.1 trypsin-like peptidase [Roseateles saccharophilus]